MSLHDSKCRKIKCSIMISFPKLILILVFQVALFAYSSAASDTIVLSESNSRRGKWRFSVSEKQLAETPDWKPGSTELSLTIEKAASLALDEFKRENEGTPVIQSIGVYSVYTSRIGYKWYYRATLYSIVNEVPDLDMIYDVVILLDGTVIPKTKL